MLLWAAWWLATGWGWMAVTWVADCHSPWRLSKARRVSGEAGFLMKSRAPRAMTRSWASGWMSPGDHDHLAAHPFSLEGLERPISVHLRHGEDRERSGPRAPSGSARPLPVRPRPGAGDTQSAGRARTSCLRANPESSHINTFIVLADLCNEDCAKCGSSAVRCNGQRCAGEN